jgi:hypothetical protein
MQSLFSSIPAVGSLQQWRIWNIWLYKYTD